MGGEHWPRQERELDVHPERQHAGETLLQRLGLLPAVSFQFTFCFFNLSSTHLSVLGFLCCFVFPLTRPSPAQIRSRDAACLRGRLLGPDHTA